MIVSAEILKNKMEEFIPAQYLPKISKCESTRDYLYDGALASMQNQED